MMNFISGFWNELFSLTLEMAPYLLLGFLFAGILYAWFPPEKLTRFMGKNNTASALNASLLGIPMPLCSCGVIPAGISFYKNGASRGSAVSFLISTPQTGVDSIMITWSLLGLPMAVIRPVIALFSGVFGGILTNKTQNSVPKTDTENNKPKHTKRKKIGVVDMLRYAFGDFMEDIVKWLVIGLLFAALIAVIVPDDFFLRYLSNDYLSMLLILVASIPMYVCATGSVPIAAVLMMKGLSPGAAIVFLMAGPATNAATISVIGNSLGRKTLIAYLTSIIGGALFFGVLVNEFLPANWFIMPGKLSQHSHELLPGWLETGSAIVLSLAIGNALYRKYLKPRFSKQNKKNFSVMTTTIKVSGMTCNHCKTNVENGIKNAEGIKNAIADIHAGEVTLDGEDYDIQKIKTIITGLGYEVE